MVDLPLAPERLVTSTAPTSSVSRKDIMQSSDQMAHAMGAVADATMDIATRQAKEQAAEDLSEQKVVRNADGSVSTVNPASSMIFGKAGDAYHEAVKAGTLAQTSNVLSEELNNLHAKHPTDPAGYKAAADAFIERYQADNKGTIGEAATLHGQQVATQHLNAITNTSANLDVTNQQKSINATIADQKNTLQGLARQPGGTDTPEFKQSLDRLKASYSALGTNPLFRMPQDQIDLEVKNFTGLLQGEALVAHVDETFTRKGKSDAQAVLNKEILQNPNLSETDRSRLYSHGMARLAYLTGDAKEKIDAGRKVVGELETNIANGTIKPTDPIIGMEIQQALNRGDPEAANRILAATTVRMNLSGISTLPQAIQAEVLGIQRTPIANQSIPAEGRALLGRIASGEATSYDMLYGGGKFQGYGDHPRVYAPITSGPDVGKKTSAAGLYQFLGSTWDQQAKKLGLKDFSPANQDAAAWDLAQTEYKAKTGRDLLATLKSGDQAAISEVPRQLSGQWASLPGGRQPASGAGPALAPAAAPGRPGFTAADLQRNPFLGSAYVRTIAADESLRVQSATQAAAGVDKAVAQGLLPRPEDVALVNQTAAQYPEKFGPVAEAMNGRLLGGALAQMEKPQRDAVIAQYREATNGQDQHHMNVAAAALEQYQKSEKNLAEKPYQEAATRGWIAPVSPIDPSQPGTIAGALGERVAASQRIAAMNHTPAPPVIGKDELPQLQAALDGPAGADVLTQIATSLGPEDMHRMLGQKGFAETLTSMQSSIDPVKMSTANAVVEKAWQRNAAYAEQALGPGSMDKLQAWQALKGSFGIEELAKRLNQSDDPGVAKTRKEARALAATETEKTTVGDIAFKMGTGSWLLGRLTGNTPDVPLDVPDTVTVPGGSLMGGALLNDYKATYTQLRSMGVPVDKASEKAAERLKSTWAPSPAVGNQLMRLPPENYYKPIEGAPNWIGEQLRDLVTASEGPSRGKPDKNQPSRQRWDISGLVADARTEREVSSGQPPSYFVAIKRANGDLDVLPNRVTFDGSKYMAKHEADLRGRRSGIEAVQNPFTNAMPLP